MKSNPQQDADGVECPKCGRSLPLYIVRCPHCGQEMYPEAVEGEETTNEPADRSYLDPLFFFFTYILSSIVLLFLIVLSIDLTARWKIWMITALIVFGDSWWISQRYSFRGKSERTLALLEAGTTVPAIVLSTLGEMRWRDGSQPEFWDWVLFAGWIITLLAAMIGVEVGQSFRSDEDNPLPRSEKELYQKLLQYCHHNPRMVERQIEYERKQAPRGSRVDWLQNAVQRQERGRR